MFRGYKVLLAFYWEVGYEGKLRGGAMFNTQVRGFISLVVLIALAVQLSGCYVTKGLVPVARRAPVDAIPASVSLSMDLSHSFDGERTTGAHNQARVDEVKKISKQVFEKSGLFKSVDYNLFKPDLFIDFKVREVEKGSAANAVISGFTLLLVPVKTGATFEVEAVLKDKQGNTIGNYNSKGDFNAIAHLIFILPIGWRFNIPNEVHTAIFEDIAAQIAADRPKIVNTM
jgi:hypothetical protein